MDFRTALLIVQCMQCFISCFSIKQLSIKLMQSRFDNHCARWRWRALSTHHNCERFFPPHTISVVPWRMLHSTCWFPRCRCLMASFAPAVPCIGTVHSVQIVSASVKWITPLLVCACGTHLNLCGPRGSPHDLLLPRSKVHQSYGKLI